MTADDDAHAHEQRIIDAQRRAWSRLVCTALRHAPGCHVLEARAHAERALRATAEALCAAWWANPRRTRVPLAEITFRVPVPPGEPRWSSWRTGLCLRALGHQVTRRRGRSVVVPFGWPDVDYLSRFYGFDPWGSADAGLSAARGQPVDRARPGAP